MKNSQVWNQQYSNPKSVVMSDGLHLQGGVHLPPVGAHLRGGPQPGYTHHVGLLY
jgi:hypothetical protein